MYTVCMYCMYVLYVRMYCTYVPYVCGSRCQHAEEGGAEDGVDLHPHVQWKLRIKDTLGLV